MKEKITTKDILWKEEEQLAIPVENNPELAKNCESSQKTQTGAIATIQPRELSAEQKKFNHAMVMSQTLAKSTIVPMHFRRKPEEIFACMTLGQELGFHPMQALNSIVIIQGTATLKAASMLAMARAAIPDMTVKIVEDMVKFEVKTTITRGSDDFTSTWNDEKAGAMGLLGNDNYKKQKMTMYRWRSVSEALKIICPDVLMGLSSDVEMNDLDVVSSRKEKEIQKAKNASLVFSQE